MKTVTLGKTGLVVTKNSFGALPIQRISEKDAVYLLQKAFYNGIMLIIIGITSLFTDATSDEGTGDATLL